MAKTLGIAFSIGAKLSPSVTSAFSTVEQRIKASASSLANLEKKTKALSAANTLRSEAQQLQTLYAAGGGKDALIKKQLDNTIAAYKKAKLAADEYGVSVANYGQEIEKANKRLAAQERRLNALNTAKKHQDAGADMRGRAMESMLAVGAVALPIHSAIQFESAMADVAKTMDGMRDPAGKLTPKFHEMEQSVLQLGRTLPLTHTELAKLFAVGGQQGMSSTSELQEFATMAAHMGVAFGMANEEAANAIGSYRTALGMTMPEVRSMLDLMNQFANTGTATEKGIAEIVQRIGSLGSVGGLAAKPLTALAATLESMKISPEIASTGIKNLILAMTAGEAATKTQSVAFAKLGVDTVALANAMQKDAPAAILSVLEAIKKLPKAEQLSIMQQIFGKESLSAIAPLLSQLDLVRQNLLTAGDAATYSGAMQKEFNNRSQTTANTLILARNRLSELGVVLGSKVLPPLVTLIETLTPGISAIADFASKNQTLTATIVGGTVAFVALRPVVFAAMAAYHGVAGAIALARAGMAALTIQNNLGTASMLRAKAATLAAAVGAKTLAAGQAVLNVALTANPIGVIVMAVAGLVGWFAKCYNQVGSFRGAILEMWNDVKGATEAVIDFFSFGDDEDEVKAKQASIEQKKEKIATSGMGTVTHGASKPQGASASTPINTSAEGSAQAHELSMAMGPTVNFTMPISINGVPDSDLAKGIFNALERNKDRVEKLISGIVQDQVRVAYGN